jgi:hypothetical protein
VKQQKLSNEEAEREFYYQIGKVVRRWQSVESSLWHLFADTLGIDQFRARIIHSALYTAKARLDLVSKLGETYIDPTLLPRFRKLMKRVNDLGQKRNLFVHAALGAGDRIGSYTVMRDVFPAEFDGTLDFSFRPINLNYIKTVSDALEKLFFDLITFSAHLSDRVHASARTHRESLYLRRAEARRKRTKTAKP